jgi:hypothetical protein
MPENDPVSIAAPTVAILTKEYQEAINLADTGSVQDYDEIRYAIWDGQSADGKKHDSEQSKVWPFDGASDTRIRLADLIINDNVDSCTAAFDLAQVNTEGIEARDAVVAGTASKALEWARNGGISNLDDEVEYAAQWGQHYGWCVMHTIWSRKISRRYEELTAQQVAQLAAGMGDKDGVFMELVLDPEQLDEAAQALASVWPKFVMAYSTAIRPDEIPDLSAGKARSIIQDLRSEGRCKFPIPYVAENNPTVIALKPFSDVWFPVDTTDIQAARAIFRVNWMTERELDAKVLTDNWDPAWVKTAKGCKGKTSAGVEPSTNDRVRESYSTLAGDNFRNLIEVVWAYTKSVDEDGVEQVNYTVFCPHTMPYGGGQFAIQESLEYSHGEYPFTLYRRERTQRAIISSRGVPEIVCSWQGETKTQRDTLQDRSSISVSPPLKVPLRNMGRSFRLGPGSQIGTTRGDDYEWMQPPPGNPLEAVGLIQQIGMDANEYFGRISEGVDPVRANRKEQRMVNVFLQSWLGVFRHVLALMQQFMTDAEWEELTGAPSPDRNFERIQRSSNWRLHYDVRNANTDWMMKKLETFVTAILPADTAGVFDRAKLAAIFANWVDPSLARAAISDARSADQKIFTQVQTDFALMALGNDTMPVENDPTSGMQLNAAQQIVQKNAKYQALLQSDKDFATKVDKWMKNRKFNLDQEQNKLIGRIGVNPNE